VRGLCVCDVSPDLTAGDRETLIVFVKKLDNWFSRDSEWRVDEVHLFTAREFFIFLDFMAKKGNYFVNRRHPCLSCNLTDCCNIFCDNDFFLNHHYPHFHTEVLTSAVTFYKHQNLDKITKFSTRTLFCYEELILVYLCHFWCLHSPCLL